MAVPTIQSAYTSGANLKVMWATVADSAITQYVVTVFFGVDTVFTTASFTPSSAALQFGSLSLPGGPLDTNTPYFVQVSTMWGSSPGQNETSQLVPLIARPPTLLAGYYDGTNFYVQWTPTEQATLGYYLQIYGSSGNPFTASTPNPGDSWAMISSPALAAGQQWYVQVSAAASVASDAGDKTYAAQAASPLMASPQPSLSGVSARYLQAGQGSQIGAQWTALSSATGVTRYRLQSFAPDGTPGVFADVVGAASTNGTLFLPGPLAPGSSLRVLALNSAGIGVATPASPVITSLPVLAGAVFASDNKSIAVSWQAGSDPAVTGFTIEIYNLADPTQSYTQTVAGGSSRSASFTSLPTSGLDATKSWGIRVWATGTTGSTPAVGGSWALPSVAPTVATLQCLGSVLNVTWSLPTGGAMPAAYAVGLLAGGKTISSVRVAGGQATQAQLSLTDATLDYSVVIAAIGAEGAQGPNSAGVKPLVATVSAVAAVTNAVTGQCTMTWTGPASATSYRLDFGNGIVTQESSTYNFNEALPDGVDLTVAITPLATPTGQSIIGPTTVHRLPTLRASVTQVSFSASAMSATGSWDALPGATGYRVALMASAGGTLTEIANTTVAAGVTQATLAFPSGYTLVSTTQYQFLVQGVWGGDRGLQANQPSIFTEGFYLSSSAAATAPPFVYPATLITTATAANNAMTGEPLTLYLPDIGAGTPLTTPLPSQGAFALTANTDVARNNAVYPYILTISNTVTSNNPWTFAPAQAIRTGLASDVQTFLKNVETAGAVPWGIVLLQQVLARALPQTFAEQLYYNFGLNFPGAGVSQGYVDLRPGMLLRVVPNPYQTVPGQTQGSWLSGYVGSASIDYPIGSLLSANGAWSAGFDSFIGQLVNNGALSVNPPSANPSTGQEQGVAEAADLYFPAFNQSFYRLFVPNALLSPSGQGSIKASDNFVLAAAASFTGISGATSAPSTNVNVAYFRGRAVLKACLQVSLDGVAHVVPVGTTLGNLLEQRGRLMPAVPMPLTGVQIERGLGGIVLDPNKPAQPASAPIQLNWQAAASAVYGPGWGAASLPLLPGDCITLE
jgi:hypothetical protein